MTKIPELFDRGLEVRKQVLGKDYVESALRTATPFNEDFQKLVTETACPSDRTPADLMTQRSPSRDISPSANPPRSSKTHVRNCLRWASQPMRWVPLTNSWIGVEMTRAIPRQAMMATMQAMIVVKKI